MIDLEVISKVFDRVLVKCGYNVIPSNSSSWKLRFPSKVRKQLDTFGRRFASYTMNSPVEWYNAIDSNGNVVMEVSGKERAVTINTKKLSDIVEELGHPVYDVHNHPHGYLGIPACFSESDFECFLGKSVYDSSKYLVKSSSVDTMSGGRMSIMKNNQFSVDDEDAFRDAYKELHRVYYDYGRELMEARRSVINDVINSSIDVPLVFLDGEHNNELARFTLDLAMQRTGSLEERLGDVRRLFNECNVEFSIEWRRDNNPYVE